MREVRIVGRARRILAVSAWPQWGASPLQPSKTKRNFGRANEIRGSIGEISSSHVTLLTALWLQTMVVLAAGDTVELQGAFRSADGSFAANQTTFWGCKVG